MALYRFPFPAEANQSTWASHGNWDEPGGGHGVGQAHNPTDEQAYAFDLDHATGGKILAARAGRVKDLDEQWADDTHPPQTPGPGNYIWIEHADGTMASYCHLQHNSVRVTIGQWVPQGYWIAACGNTGHSSGPHLHFDVHTYGKKGQTSSPGLGTQLLIHFEDKTRFAFRPAPGEALSGKSNNVEGDYRQDHWRHCVRCHVLYFAGVSRSACPRGDEHDYRGGGNYTLAVDGTNPQGQRDWKHCRKCQTLFFSGGANTRCPAGPGSAHDGSHSGNYALLTNVQNAAGHQNGWRWCKNCGVLWFNASDSKCPATGQTHSLDGSGDYTLHHTPDDWQRHWRLCGKCGCLFNGEYIAQSKCAGNSSAPHVIAHPTQNYFLTLNSPDAPGQSQWRWCHKCQCLWMGLNAGSRCPAGAAHALDNSGDYIVLHQADANGPGEKNWRWCHKCQGLWFAGLAATRCPAGGQHSQSGSGKYRVQYDAHSSARDQAVDFVGENKLNTFLCRPSVGGLA
jgi:Peptidase family M23